MLIRQVRSLGSPRKETGEQADIIIGSLRLLQDTHLIYRGSNFSLKRQGGLLSSIASFIKGFIRSGSLSMDKEKNIKGSLESFYHLDRACSLKGISRESLYQDC